MPDFLYQQHDDRRPTTTDFTSNLLDSNSTRGTDTCYTHIYHMMPDVVMTELPPPMESNDGNTSNGNECNGSMAQSSEEDKRNFAIAEVDAEIATSTSIDPTVPVPPSVHEHDEGQNNNNGETNHQAKKQRKDSYKSENQHDPNSFNAIEKLLSVPLHYILRRTSSQNNNPHLLSRMEAALLLQITTISYELDSLFQMSIEAIENSHTCKIISEDIHNSSNAFLRPIHCLLHTYGRIVPQQVIQHVQNHLEGILGHFPIIIQSLRQCAEQNWSVSNALLDMNMGGMSINMLGKEKGLLAEIEEEVCKRLEGLMDVCNEEDATLPVLDSFDSTSMKSFCARLFAEEGASGGGGDRDCDNGDGEEDNSLKLQDRTASIQDAATALGLLASARGNTADISV